MRFEYTGIFGMLGDGIGLGLLIAVFALAVLWGVLYLLDRIFPETPKDEADHMPRLVETKIKALPKPNGKEHRKAA